MGETREEGRLDLPRFSGVDPLGFIAEVEWQFVENGIPEEEELTAVRDCFEGSALWWLQVREFLAPFCCLRELWEAALVRFGGKKRTLEGGKSEEGSEEQMEKEEAARVTVAEEITFLEVEDEVLMCSLGSKKPGQEKELDKGSGQESWALERGLEPTLNFFAGHPFEETERHPKFNKRNLGFLALSGEEEIKGAVRVELGRSTG